MSNSNLIDYLVKMNTDQAQSALKGMTGGMGSAIEQLTGFNVSALAAGGVIAGFAGFIVSATKKVQDYNIGMGKTADLIGVNVEEYSRLVQAGDDLRISQDSITMAMKMAIQNGFNPSIANLSILADKVAGMTDQVQIANVLQPIFGRQWNEIYPLLAKGGQALKDNTAAIADNMVATKASVEASRNLAINLDNLGDAATGVANTFGNAAIPIMTEFLTKLQEGAGVIQMILEWQGRLNKAYEDQDLQLAKTSDGYEDYEKKTIASYLATGKLTKAEYENLIVGREQMPIAQEFLRNLGMRNQFEFLAAKATDTTAQAMARQTTAMVQSNQAVYNGATGWSALPSFMQAYITKADAVYAANMQNAQAVATIDQNFKNMQASGQAALDAIDNARTAQEGFQQSFAQAVDAELKARGLTGKALTDREAIIDKAFGTELKWNTDVATSAKALADKYANSSDLAGFQAAMTTKATELQTENDKLAAGLDLINKQTAGLAYLTGQTWMINVMYSIQGGIPSVPSVVPKTGKGGHVDPVTLQWVPDAAAGVNFVVPAGYPNDSFRIQAQTGEHVEITPAGQTTNNNGGNTYNIYVTGGANELMRKLKAMNGGAYQGQ